MTAPPAGRSRPLRWWREVAYVVVFYAVYSAVRNGGVAEGSAGEAFANARDVIAVERRLGLYVEEGVQQAFLDHEWFIRVWNIFYGSAHFVVTAAILVWLFRTSAARYRIWRTVLAVTTALALIGYAAFPLMPPRLLPPSYGFVDTLAVVGGLWSFDSGAVASVSNQYAAMPSLHFAWSAWCALAVASVARRRWVPVVAVLYPAATLFAIVVTANHFWLDAVGGAVVLAAGSVAGTLSRPARHVRLRPERPGATERAAPSAA